MTLMLKKGMTVAAVAIGLFSANQAVAQNAASSDAVATPVAEAGKWWMPKSAKIGLVGVGTPKMNGGFNANDLTAEYIKARRLAYPISSTNTNAIADYAGYNLSVFGKESGGYLIGATWSVNKNFDAEVSASYVRRKNLGLTYAVVMPKLTTGVVAGQNVSSGKGGDYSPYSEIDPAATGTYVGGDRVELANAGLKFEYKYANIRASLLYKLPGSDFIKPYIGGGLTVTKFGAIRDVMGTNGASLNRMLFAFNQLNSASSKDNFMASGAVGNIEFKDKQTYSVHVAAGANFKVWEKSGIDAFVNYSHAKNKVVITRNAYQTIGSNTNISDKTVKSVRVEMPVDYSAYQIGLAWVKEF